MEEQIRIPPITVDPTVVFFEDERPEEAKLYAEQKAAAKEAWKNIIENENNVFQAAQFTVPGDYGQTLILSPSTRDGVDWQLSFFDKDGVPSMHEDYIADGTENPNRSRDNDMEALLRRLVNYSLHNREIIVTAAYEDKERESLMEKDIVKVQSASRSNFEGYVALAQFDRNNPNADHKIYLGKSENYDNQGNYDNSDNSLVFISNNEKLYSFLYGSGWVRTQQEMIDNDVFTAQDYAEYAQLKEGVLKQFEDKRTREVKFGIDITARRRGVESGVPFRYPNWNQNQRLFMDMGGTLTIFTPQASTAPLYEQGYFLNLQPHENVVEAVRYIIQNHPEIEVNLLSAYLDDSPYALAEKQAWMDKNLPEIDPQHRIFVPNGSDKKQFIGGLRPDDYLMDDYTRNLLRWEPGKGIKLLNSINHTRGTWQHDRIRYDRDPKDLANAILAVMQGQEHIYDKRVEREAVVEALKQERERLEERAGCKIGQTLYGLAYPSREIVSVIPETVQNIKVDGDTIEIETDEGYYSPADFGKTIFLTNEEAEAVAAQKNQPEHYEAQETQEDREGGSNMAEQRQFDWDKNIYYAGHDFSLIDEWQNGNTSYGLYLDVTVDPETGKEAPELYMSTVARKGEVSEEDIYEFDNKPSREEVMEKYQGQNRDILDGLTERDMRQVIFEYETLTLVPEVDRMTRWYSEENVAVQKPFYGENQTPISQDMIAQKCREILQSETRENLRKAYDAIVHARGEVMELEIGGLAGRLQERAAADMNRQDSPWGSWFATISNPARPEDYIQLDITGYSTRNSVIETATLVLGGNVQEVIDLPEMNFDDYGNEEGFDTGFAQKVADLAQRFDPSLTSGYLLYAPAGWSDHSLDEHRNLLKENGYSDMPNYEPYRARMQEEAEVLEQREAENTHREGEEPLVDIYDLAYDDEGYLHFNVTADGYQLEGLYRLHDPANGEDMELVSIDYGDRHPIIERQWDRIEAMLSDAAQDRYNALIAKENEQEQAVNMPDPSVVPGEMENYGYVYDQMLPLGAGVARDLWENRNAPIYRLYQDNTESLVESVEEIAEHAANGGMFGIEKEDWIKVQERTNGQEIAYSENEALVKLAERIDEFVYANNPDGYREDVGTTLEDRSEYRAHLANALENGEYSPMIDTITAIRDEYQGDERYAAEIQEANELIYAMQHIDEYQQSYGREAAAQGERDLANADEAAFLLDGENYLYIQTTEEGYDYTFYDKDLNEIDGGVLENSALSLTEARDIVIDSHAFEAKNIELISEQEWEQMNEYIQKNWEEDRAIFQLAQRLDQFAWNCNSEEASQSWHKDVRELAIHLKTGDVKDTLAWVESGLVYLQNSRDPDNVAHMIREAKDLIYTVQHLDQFRQFHDRETAPNARIPIREFTDNQGRTLEGSQIPGMNIAPNTIGYADRAAVFNAVRDFEEANDLPANQREIHNGTVEDKDFLYSGYDRHVGMSHRNDLSIQPYMERLTAMAEDKNKYISLLPLVAEVYYAQQNGLTPEQINYILDGVQDDKIPLDAIKNLRHGFESGLNQEQMAVLAGENSFAQEALMGYMADGGSVENATALKGCDVAQYYILSSHLNEGSFGPEMAKAIIQAVNGIKEWNEKDFDAQRDANQGNPKWRFSQMDCEFFTEYLADQAMEDKSITPDMIADIGARFVAQRDTDNLRKFIEGNGGFHYFGDHREEQSQEARLVEALRKYAGQDFLSYGVDASADFRAAADALENRADNQQRIPLVLIERLRNYSEHAFNQHDRFIAENLRDVADVLVKIREQNPEKAEPVVQTPEEKAVTEGVALSPEKKDAKDLLNDQLQQGILNTLSSEGFKSWLDTNGKLFLNNYSFRNAVLVWMQKPDVSYTMGYEQWKQYGRNVNKGAQGVKIFVPVVAYEKKEGDLWNMIKRSLNSQMKANPSKEHVTYRIGMSNMEVSLHKGGLYSLRINGKERGLKSENDMKKFIKNSVLGKVPMYFTVGTVFDVKDTMTPEYLWVKKGFTKDEMVRDEKGNAIKNKKGEYKIVNTPERQARFNTQLDMSVPQIDEKKAAILYDALKEVSKRNGIPVFEMNRADDETLKKGADGYFKREFTDETPKGFIVMPTDLDPTKKVSVLLHEMGHSELHGDLTKLAQKMGEKNIPSDMREVQAEAVAYVVGKNFGIESGTSTFNYLAAYTKGFELQALSKSIEVIYNECKQLTNELKTELEARGLNMDLSERRQPMGKEAVQTVSKAYASYVVEQSERIAVIEKELIPLAAQNRGKDTAITALVAQSINIKRQKEDVEVIEGKITELEAAQTLPEQMGCIHQIDAAKDRIENYKKEFSDLTEHFQEAVQNEQSLKGRFVADPVATIKDMGKNMDYVQLGALSDAQVQYLAKSEYVSAELAPLLRNDPAKFEEKACERATQIDKVASKNGMFVEVTFCEQWTDTPIVENGALMHPKVADTIVKQAETQIRGLRQQADSVGDYFPYAKCDLMIYQAKKGEITTAYKTHVDIGDGSQGSLLDHLKHISSAKDITPAFETATRERGAKEKIVFNAAPEQDVQVQEKPTREAMPSDRGMSREEWMQEINERREAEKAEGGQHQQEHTDRPKSAKRDLEHG